MGIETSLQGIDFTSPNTLLIIANIILITIAFFLLARLRRSRKKRETKEPGIHQKKEQKGELAGIAEIKPEEFNLERLDLKPDFLTGAKTAESIPIIGTGAAGTGVQVPIRPWLKPVEASVPDAAEKPGIEMPERKQVPEVKAPEIKAPEVEPPVMPRLKPVEVTVPESAESPKIKAPVPEAIVPEVAALETDELELEDELPEEFVKPLKFKIPKQAGDEMKLVTEPDLPHGPVTKPVEEKVKQIPEPTLPLDLEKILKIEEEELPEEIYAPQAQETSPSVAAEAKSAEAAPAAPEVEKPVEKEKMPEEISAPAAPELMPHVEAEAKSAEAAPAAPEVEKPVEKEKMPEEISAPAAPELMPHMEAEAKSAEAPEFKFVTFEEKKPEEITAPTAPEKMPPEKEEAKSAEVPEFKFVTFEEKKPEEITAPPEVRLFTPQEKKPEGIAAPPAIDILTREETKKPKRKSLF